MYLISADRFPVTGEEIAAEIGLQGRQLLPVIEAGIASICTMSNGRVRREIWAIRCDDRFRDVCRKFGRVVEYGPRGRLQDIVPNCDPRCTDPGIFRACTCVANKRDIENVRKRIVRWCMRQTDICDQLHREEIARREFVTKAPMTAALVAGLAGALGVELADA